jgi:hypothetical protein
MVSLRLQGKMSDPIVSRTKERAMQKGIWFGFVLGSMTAAIAALAAEEKLTPKDLPAKITHAVDARFPGAQVTSAEKEKENGQVVYDLELTQNGVKYEMDVKEDGTIMEIEKQVKEPAAVITGAVLKKYPDAKIKIVMEVNKVDGNQETPQKYEITLTTGGKEKEVVVSLDGSSVKEEAEEGDKK